MHLSHIFFPIFYLELWPSCTRIQGGSSVSPTTTPNPSVANLSLSRPAAAQRVNPSLITLCTVPVYLPTIPAEEEVRDTGSWYGWGNEGAYESSNEKTESSEYCDIVKYMKYRKSECGFQSKLNRFKVQEEVVPGPGQ